MTYFMFIKAHSVDKGFAKESNMLTYLVERQKHRLAAEEKFPKTAVGLPNAEVKFQQDLVLNCCFVSDLMGKYATVGIHTTILHKLFGQLGQFMNNILYMEWAHFTIDEERPSVTIPDACLVGKYV